MGSGGSAYDVGHAPLTPAIADSSSRLNLEHLTPLYLALQIIGGQIGLPIIITTILFSKRISRHPTLINFCITWVIYSISYCILIYSGQRHDPNPPGSVCFAQAAMIHGAPTMAGTAGLAVVVHIWSTMKEPPQTWNVRRKWPWTICLTISLVLPYVVFFSFTAASAILQHKYPETVNASNGLYCTIYKDPFRNFAVPAFCTAIMMLVLGFEVVIAVRYYRIWRRITSVFPLADRHTSTPMVIRVAIFNLYSVITLCAGILFLSNTPSPWPSMIQAALPLTAVLVFGTQEDLLRVWCFWRREQKPSVNASDDNIPSAHQFRASDSEACPIRASLNSHL